MAQQRAVQPATPVAPVQPRRGRSAPRGQTRAQQAPAPAATSQPVVSQPAARSVVDTTVVSQLQAASNSLNKVNRNDTLNPNLVTLCRTNRLLNEAELTQLEQAITAFNGSVPGKQHNKGLIKTLLDKAIANAR